MHQPFGYRPLVAQRRQIPPVVGHRVAETAVVQQPRIRVRGVGQPVQQCRQQHPLNPTTPPATAGQRGQMGQRALRPFVPQGGELALRGFGAHPDRQAHRRLGDRLQQWLIEQLGVQPRHPVALAPQLLPQHAQRVVAAVGTHVRRARQPAQRLVVVKFGQHVGALEALEL